MSDTTTPNHGFILPAIGASRDTWGAKLNDNFSQLDDLLLSSAGGEIAGNLHVHGQSQLDGTVGVGGFLAIAFPTINDFYIQRGGGQRQIHWSNTDSLNWTEANSYTQFVHSGSVTFSVSPVGDIAMAGSNAYKVGGSSTWTVTSDVRVKRKIARYPAGLAEICKLDPISFQYNGQGGTRDDGHRYYGLSAQDAQPIMPELVSRAPNNPGYLAMDFGPLTLALINSVKELTARVRALEAR